MHYTLRQISMYWREVCRAERHAQGRAAVAANLGANGDKKSQAVIKRLLDD